MLNLSLPYIVPSLPNAQITYNKQKEKKRAWIASNIELRRNILGNRDGYYVPRLQ